ncbi:MAG: cytochrome oxidase [Gammaproteobacteria bacterium]
MLDENDVWIISLAGMSVVALVFLWVIFEARRVPRAQRVQPARRLAPRVRRWLFVVLIVVFAGASYASLKNYPIPPQHSPLHAKQVVNVVGHQWYWQMSSKRITADEPVEFRVTSADVNHGFAIYSPEPDFRILVQTQAMPGYYNKILYTFKTPGTYTVDCLEYCGLGHSAMTTTFQVVAPDDGGPSA